MTDTQLPADLFADLDRHGPVPLWYQISTRLEASILSGRLPAGARLENEVGLGERLGLSRPTIRRAIQELVDKGLVVRRRGIGTQVVHGPVTRNVELTSLFEDLTESGQAPTTRLLAHGVVPADEKTALALGIGVGDQVSNVRRLRLADGVPVAILENFLPLDLAQFSDDDLSTRGLYQLLRAHGVTMRVAKQQIGARAAHFDEAHLLEIEPRGAVLTMTRTAYDASGRAVEVGHHCYRPDLYSFSITLVDK
ncbi:GntR family transcriptional regulator [Frigoribacterium sp. CFBP9030]|uniref:GntR family transcriptional regulator n=1 Tax=Frigoribacterium sp. CFBP9030 TaxID=3096537 RepID=UPI002A6AF572|nr:GntR family transcriptional regulator [Frigoribacterium sp. CFBP9030]MDY0892339.1 GntR family transcriptional regulator [Frigoribacterium sp. CFBP9030]